MTKINTNTAALMANAYGQQANNRLLQPMQRLSSGLRINSAADDAAGLAVVNKMTAAIKDYDVSVRNSTDVISMLAIAEAALAQFDQIQMRLKDLAVQSANGVYTQEDRDAMELELYALVAEMDRISENTMFNGTKLLDGTLDFGGSAKTGSIPVRIDQFGSGTTGRYWEDSSFDNGSFEEDLTVSTVGNVSTIEGWEIHNVRVELGEDGSLGPENILDRSGASISNLIGGFRTPEDPTPRPFSNDIAYRKLNRGPDPDYAPDSELPGTNDSERPVSYGTLENGSATGFRLENGGITLTATSLTSNYGFDIVHGSYIVSQGTKTINAGDRVEFDWVTQGAGDASDVFAYLLNADTGDTQVLLDETWDSPTAASGKSSTTVTASGNYKFVFINGTYDASGGMALGAEMAIDNINVVRQRLPASEQHLISQISVLTVDEAINATEVLTYSLEQTSFSRAILGALMNRYETAVEGATFRGQDMREARSRIRDADYAIETARLAKFQILSQASTAMLAQASQSKQAVLALID
jgi:flagellin